MASFQPKSQISCQALEKSIANFIIASKVELTFFSMLKYTFFLINFLFRKKSSHNDGKQRQMKFPFKLSDQIN